MLVRWHYRSLLALTAIGLLFGAHTGCIPGGVDGLSSGYGHEGAASGGLSEDASSGGGVPIDGSSGGNSAAGSTGLSESGAAGATDGTGGATEGGGTAGSAGDGTSVGAGGRSTSGAGGRSAAGTGGRGSAGAGNANTGGATGTSSGGSTGAGSGGANSGGSTGAGSGGTNSGGSTGTGSGGASSGGSAGAGSGGANSGGAAGANTGGAASGSQGVIAFSVPLTKSGQDQRYADTFSPLANLANTTMTLRLYAPGATAGTLVIYLSDADFTAGSGTNVPFTSISTGWKDVSFSVGGVAGSFDPAQINQVTIEVTAGTTGPWANPTVVYIDSISASNLTVNDTFDSSLGRIVKSSTQVVAGSTVTWYDSIP